MVAGCGDDSTPAAAGHVPPGGRGRRQLQLTQVTGGRPGHGARTSPLWKSLWTAGRLRGGSRKAGLMLV